VKILVTGGAGFIASHVVDALVKEGHEVSVVDDLSMGRREQVHPSARFYRVDIRQREALDGVFRAERPELVNHHAAQGNLRRSITEPSFDASVNILGSLVLIELSLAYKVRKFIYISSGGAVYGRNDTSDPYGCSNGWLEPEGPPLVASIVPIASGSDANGNLWSLALSPAGNATELELLLATIGTYLPLEPLGDADLGTTTAVSPTDTPLDAPPVEGLPGSVYGIVSDRVARIELRTDGGEIVEGSLYPIPPGTIDAEQAFLILAPIAESFTGTILAYDAAGRELQSTEVTTVR